VSLDGRIDEDFCEAVDLIGQLVFLQQVTEGKDGRRIRITVIDQLNTGNAAHGGHLLRNLREKNLPFGLLLGRGQLEIREAEPAAHHPSLDLRLQGHCRVDDLGFPETP